MKNLNKRKRLAARVLGVGIGKIYFNPENNADIKEAITKQDIRDLYAAGAIGIKENLGRKTKEKRENRRGPGKIKKIVVNKKLIYATLTRKLRRYILELRKQSKISEEKYWETRKMIKSRTFKDKAHLKHYLGEK